MPEASWLLFVVASLVLVTTRGQGMILVVWPCRVGRGVTFAASSPRSSRKQSGLCCSGQIRWP
jgi:hypothetical protein